MTFADAAEKARVGKTGHSRVAITDPGKVPAERLHPKAAYSRWERDECIGRYNGHDEDNGNSLLSGVVIGAAVVAVTAAIINAHDD